MTYRKRFWLLVAIGMIALHIAAILAKISHPQPVSGVFSGM